MKGLLMFTSIYYDSIYYDIKEALRREYMTVAKKEIDSIWPESFRRHQRFGRFESIEGIRMVRNKRL